MRALDLGICVTDESLELRVSTRSELPIQSDDFRPRRNSLRDGAIERGRIFRIHEARRQQRDRVLDSCDLRINE